MTPYSVLIEIEVVINYVINNFKLHDQLSRISLQESLKFAKFSHFVEKIIFGLLYRLLVRKGCIIRS